MIIYPTIRLEADGLTTLELNPEDGFYGQALDLGDALTRVVVDDAPDADGTDDTTMFVGARNVTLSVIIYPDAGGLWALRSSLRAFTHPRIRPYMYVQLAADAPEQRIQLRRSQYTDVIGDGPRAATQEDQEAAQILVQWVAPLGILESSDEHSELVYASDPTPPGGRTYSLTFSRTYPAAGPTGVGTITNAGNADAYPLIRLYGPATEPIIENVTQGKLLEFDGLTINAGEFLEIDTRAKTIYLNGDPTASAYDKLLYPNSSWWTLSPGDNLIKYRPATFTAATTIAEIVWRDVYL